MKFKFQTQTRRDTQKNKIKSTEEFTFFPFTLAVCRSRLHKLLEIEIERFRDSDRELFELV
jgi:hypothetical protein